VQYVSLPGHYFSGNIIGGSLVGGDDREDFEALYRANVRAVLAFVLTRTTRQDAQDVVSNTFLVAWRRIDAVPDDPLPWLIGVARKVLADQRRSEARRNALSRRIAGEAATHSTVDGDVAVSMELRGAIGAALLQLRLEDREIVTLTAWQGFTTEQLATSLGCSKALASLRLHRARRRFARFLEEQLEDPLPVGGASVRPAKETP
jgi:RNA polymerase sigma-70 factor (ECF subfamily)